MKFQVVTLYPELIQSYFNYGVVGSAVDKKLIDVQCVNPRSFTSDVHKTVDDRPYGGGDGMVMLASVLEKSIQDILSKSKEKPRVVYLSAQGSPLSEVKVKALAEEKELILVNGRYGGIDQRFINQYVDEEISIGDYILSGGELASLVLMDAVSRKIPGVLGHKESSVKDSFSSDYKGGLEAPLFTRPAEWNGQKVPAILTEGHHQKMEEWKHLMSELITLQKRPDLFSSSKTDLDRLKKFYFQLSSEEKKVCGLKEGLF